jgi:magnesium transporter
MTLVTRLANQVLREHPSRAASVLERSGLAEAVPLLTRGEPTVAAEVLRRLAPHFAAAVLERSAPERASRLLDTLELDVAARLARRLSGPLLEAILQRTGTRRARALRAVLHFPEGSAGALMDPDVLALPEELSAREALRRVRETASQARYNLYVVDREGHLVGVLNLRELLLARPRAQLSDLMVRDPARLDARADRASVLSHAGWREVHALPVVDEEGAYLGAVRYRTLRALEEELLRPRSQDADASAALGQLFAAGAGGLLDALSGAPGGGGARRGA